MIGHFHFEETLDQSQIANTSITSIIGAQIRQLFTWLNIGHQRPRYHVIEDLDSTALRAHDTAQNAIELKSLEEEDPEHPGVLPAQEETIKKKIYTSQVIFQMVSISLLAFHKVASDIIMPVFLASPQGLTAHENEDTETRNIFQFDDGFNLSTRQIGPILLSQAFIAVLGQFFLVPCIIGTYGPLCIYRYVLWLYPLMYLLTPFMAQLFRPLSIITVMLDLWVKVLLSSTAYTCSAIL